MKTREELVKTEEFWFETIQNDIFRMVDEYLKENDINRTEFAKRLGYSKGYVSQILNGEFNCSLKKLIDLTLAVEKVPYIDFKSIEDFVKADSIKRFNLQYSDSAQIHSLAGSFSLKSEPATAFVATYHVETKQHESQFEELEAA